jgi:prepilin-type N-terminal cleavage/methylation domain-containing protein
MGAAEVSAFGTLKVQESLYFRPTAKWSFECVTVMGIVTVTGNSEAKNMPTNKTRNDAGFSMIELIMVLVVGVTLTACAIPLISSVVHYYRLRAAVSSATWAIQSVRFQSLEEGYPFQVTFTAGTGSASPTYQIASEAPGATTFTNVGSSVPLSGSAVTLNQTETFQFKGNGTVATSPASNAPYQFTISYSGTTETITVSNYGNVDVTP